MSSQNVFRLDIQKELRVDPGTETTEVWGEMEIQSPAMLNAADLRLKSIENILLTPDSRVSYYATKQVMNKGRKGNTASIYLFDGTASGSEVTSGSHYLNFLAMGE